MTVILGIVALVCAIGWLTRYITCAALFCYMGTKGCEQPSDEEMDACVKFVTRKMFRL